VTDSIIRAAVISDCGTYRYSLRRTWNDDSRGVLWVMLNPSTADASKDDPTIRKVCGFTRQWCFGDALVCNLFAFRATDPKELQRAHKRGVDIIGPENLEHLRKWSQRAQRIVVAWGAHAEPYDATVDRVMTVLRSHNHQLYCLGTSKSGQPRHPLMLAYSTPVVAFPVSGQVTT